MPTYDHVPVMPQEVIQFLAPHPDGAYLDATIGGGGHAERVLDMTSPHGRLVGIDADPLALALAEKRLERFGMRVTLVNAYFDRLGIIAAETGLGAADGVLFDLGVSSGQLASQDRGFSFQGEAPLDMRMGPQANTTAADLLRSAPEAELARIFFEYGEERHARQIARRVVLDRRRRPIRTTSDLVGLVMQTLPASRTSRQRIHPATRIFQALRIAVNDELARLRTALAQALDVLGEAGRLVVIAFHSLEDRIVKRFLQTEARDCLCPSGLVACVCAHERRVRILTAKPVRPSRAETDMNPRARSAKLRAAEKLKPSPPEPGRDRRTPAPTDAGNMP